MTTRPGRSAHEANARAFSGDQAAETFEAAGQLTRGVAHDLNNLLTAILGYANLLGRTFEADDVRHSDVQEIVRSAQQASDLTHQLLSIGRSPDPAAGHLADQPGAGAGGNGPAHIKPAPRQAPPEAVTHQAPRVLVVEDERAVRYLVRTILSRLGYEVFEAGDPDEAGRWLASSGQTADLLIADVMMPGASGPEFCRRAREIQPSLKVLYMSGYTDEAIGRDRLLEPGVAFVQKPFTADDLTRKVREVLGH